MEIIAKATYLKISPRKLRLISKGFLGASPLSALKRLSVGSQHGAVYLIKAIKQAQANAVNNFKINIEELKIKRIEVNEGPKAKRQDVSHGARFDRGIIQKRTSHLIVVLENKDSKKIEKQKEEKVIEFKPEIQEEPKKLEPKKVVKKVKEKKSGPKS